MRLLVIYRSERWSPGPLNPAKDAVILDAVVTLLHEQGHEVVTRAEDELLDGPAAATRFLLDSFDAIFSMARSLKLLMQLQQSGVRCYNAPRAVMHTSQSREDTLTLLQSAGLPIPPFWAYEAEEDEMFLCEPHLQALLPAWIKAMHPQGVHEGDVQCCYSPLEADTRLMQLQAEGYSDIIAMQHVEGTLLKCYAVLSRAHTLLNLDTKDYKDVLLNDLPAEWAGLRDTLSQMALRISETLGLEIFGFDVIIDADQQAWIIDVNDWPSFSSVRDEAARRIVALLQEQ